MSEQETTEQKTTEQTTKPNLKIAELPNFRNEVLVEEIKSVLELAEKGEIVGAIFVGERPDGSIRNFASTFENRFVLIGYLHTLIFDLIDSGKSEN